MAKGPCRSPRPYQLWTGQMWLLESAMAYLGETQQQGLPQSPASLHPHSWLAATASCRSRGYKRSPWGTSQLYRAGKTKASA